MRPRKPRKPMRRYLSGGERIRLFQPAGNTRSKATGEVIPGEPIRWDVGGGVVEPPRPGEVSAAEGVVLAIRQRIFWVYWSQSLKSLCGSSDSWTLEYQGRPYRIESAWNPYPSPFVPKVLHLLAEAIS